ncbi:MAG: hypothetical protein WA672_17980 [Candidatus Angelobacter sp.]
MGTAIGSTSETVAAMQFCGKFAGERRFMFGNKVIREIADGEVFEEETLRQSTKVSFQPSDDLQHIERIDSQFAERSGRIQICTQITRHFGEKRL